LRFSQLVYSCYSLLENGQIIKTVITFDHW